MCICNYILTVSIYCIHVVAEWTSWKTCLGLHSGHWLGLVRLETASRRMGHLGSSSISALSLSSKRSPAKGTSACPKSCATAATNPFLLHHLHPKAFSCISTHRNSSHLSARVSPYERPLPFLVRHPSSYSPSGGLRSAPRCPPPRKAVGPSPHPQKRKEKGIDANERLAPEPILSQPKMKTTSREWERRLKGRGFSHQVTRREGWGRNACGAKEDGRGTDARKAREHR